MSHEELVAESALTGSGPVEVLGDGALAERLRERLGAGAGGGLPGVVVEATGTAAGLRRALAVVADRGLVVLAGPEPPATVVLDCYADLHLRALTVIGIPAGGDRDAG